MAVQREKVIEVSSLVVMGSLLYKFIPRGKLREAHLAFLFNQVITWLFGLFVVEKGFIKYPERLFFKRANKSSFSFEYFIFPACNALFNIHYPETRNKLIKTFYYLLFTLPIVILEVFAVRKTKLISYKNWTWYWSFMTIWLTYHLSRWYFRWFFRINKWDRTL